MDVCLFIYEHGADTYFFPMCNAVHKLRFIGLSRYRIYYYSSQQINREQYEVTNCVNGAAQFRCVHFN